MPRALFEGGYISGFLGGLMGDEGSVCWTLSK